MGDAHLAEVKRPPLVRVAVLSVCLLLIGLAVAWLYFPMRAVLDVGGYCAEGGPYVIETHCPEGSTLFLMLGVPLWFAGRLHRALRRGDLSAAAAVFAGWRSCSGTRGNFLEYPSTPTLPEALWGVGWSAASSSG